MSVKDLAFRITRAFEGRGYATFQNYEKGIGFSYGADQATYSSGTAVKIIERYCANPYHKVMELDRYLPKLRFHDPSLSTNQDFIDLLRLAGEDIVMHEAQDYVATKNYWDAMQALSCRPRGIVTELGQCFLHDCAINQGVGHDMILMAEDFFDVPHHSKLDVVEYREVTGGHLNFTVRERNNGLHEIQLLAKVAEIKADRFMRLAAADPHKRGLIPRARFWQDRFDRYDIHLLGVGLRLQLKAGLSVSNER